MLSIKITSLSLSAGWREENQGCQRVARVPKAAAPIPRKVHQINTLENHPLLYGPMIVVFLAISAMRKMSGTATIPFKTAV